jgi:bacteriorhodopsin
MHGVLCVDIHPTVITLSFFKPRGNRAFHHIAIAILTIAAIDYFAMASDLGSTPIITEFRGRGEARAIWVSDLSFLKW